ncbi:hypothetical protein HNR64_003007 [Spongiibacter marinus]|nr:hypothetical protein [Spongiibacter marinus]
MRRLNEREEVAVPLGMLFVPIILMRTSNYQVAVFGVVLFFAIYIFYSKYFFPDTRSKIVALLGAVTVGIYGLDSCRNGKCNDYSHDIFEGIVWSDSVYIAYLVTVSFLIFKNYRKNYR